MSELIIHIEKLLGEDPTVSSDNETTGQYFLIRLLLIALGLYYFSVSIVALVQAGIIPFIVPCAGFVLMVALLLLSYHTGSNLIMPVFIALPILIGTVLSSEFGAAGDFHLTIPLGISIVFISVSLSIGMKFFVSALLVIAELLISMFVETRAPIYTVSSGTMVAFRLVSLLFLSAFIFIVSYYFCIKFTQAEHKIYVYNRQLKKMASMDPLTNLMNRRGMSEVLPDLQKEYMMGINGLSIAIGDIDFFKKINDNYGHDCGDYILKSVSEIFAKYMEGKGEVCRWGGEEFLFAFTHPNPDNVFVLLNDLRHNIKHTHFNFNGTDIRLTMTFGLEEYSPSHDLDSTIKAADQKLYLGKESGRDKVVY